jgi:hypothetical protein
VFTYTVTTTNDNNCANDSASGTITVIHNSFRMTTTAGDVNIGVEFTGILYIDWGDGTSNTYTGNGLKSHTFVSGVPSHTVTAQARTITTWIVVMKT